MVGSSSGPRSKYVTCATARQSIFLTRAYQQNNAQFCNATKRVYIHEQIYDAVRDAMVAEANATVVGDGSMAGVHLGPIQNDMQ